MNKRAAGQYLDTLFGDGQGYVAVAYKDRDASWQECQFAWPQDKAKLLGWAEVHQDANVFVCPALRRDVHTRKKGDMLPTRWLWADVDWQNVPRDRVADVQARIAELGSLVVKSGTTDEVGRSNVHVYVELSSPVGPEDHIKLNTGLRDYLYADNKQADNSLLRLPGTTNWKTETGSPVVWPAQRGGRTTKAALMKRRVFRDVKVVDDWTASEWEFVEPEGLSNRVIRLVQMPIEEALARYKKRHRAVWAVTKDLIRKEYDPDIIHSLMHTFPAALSKAAEENGYDVHRDVDKCLAYHRQVEADPESDDDALEELDDAAYERARDAETDDDIEKWAQLEYKRNQARKRAKQIEAERVWVAPPPGVSWSLSGALKHPPQPVPHLIEGLCGIKHNVVITAQFKTGKTAFTMGSIAQALCDGQPFLDHFPTKAEGGLVVGHWNCEMDPDEMLDDYIRPVGIENTDNLNVANLRGYPINILSEMGRKWAIAWLRGEIPDAEGKYPLPCKVWTIDSFARLARMAGVSEKDNDEVMSLLMALDQIKVEAGVDVLFLITHTGRMEHEEGKERARGATAIDDWADARWIMTKMDKTRFLRVEGRGVSLEDTALVYDPGTQRSVLGFGGKTEVREETAKDAVVKIVNEQPGISKTILLKALAGVGISNRAAAEPIEEAIEGGFIEVKMVQRRGKPSVCHFPLDYKKPEGDRTMRATPADVDLRVTHRRVGRRKPTS
jgi:AAA domain-containing protein